LGEDFIIVGNAWALIAGPIGNGIAPTRILGRTASGQEKKKERKEVAAERTLLIMIVLLLCLKTLHL
jgi:hypothetical protein